MFFKISLFSYFFVAFGSTLDNLPSCVCWEYVITECMEKGFSDNAEHTVVASPGGHCNMNLRAALCGNTFCQIFSEMEVRRGRVAREEGKVPKPSENRLSGRALLFPSSCR